MTETGTVDHPVPMSNANLPFTGFPATHGRSPVRRVERLPDPVSAYGDAGPGAAAPPARLVRVRTLPRPEALARATEWTAHGARPLDAPPGWTAWERRHGDTETGRPRVQRLAVDARDPATVVNWSTPAPADAADETHWLGVLAARAADHRTAPPERGGWTA